MKPTNIINKILYYLYYFQGSIAFVRKGIWHGIKRICHDIKDFLERIWYSLRRKDFGYVWIFIVIIGISAYVSIQCHWFKWLTYACIVFIILILTLTKRPMNIVYGLIGTSGSIEKFFLSFVIINLVFGGIYYFGFFSNAEISYDFNQPHVRFERLYSPPITQKDTIFIYSDSSRSYFLQEKDLPQYQKITWEQVLSNTVMTSLIQEPTDLFVAAVTHNKAMYNTVEIDCQRKRILEKQDEYDSNRSQLLHWILILQILISWILLGVFISILYNRFRYDS